MAIDRSLKWYLGSNSDDGIVMGLNSTDLIAFYGGTPTVQLTLPAAATDTATAQALANSIRTGLLATNLFRAA